MAHLATQGSGWPVLALWLWLRAALGRLSTVDLDLKRPPDSLLRPAAGWLPLTLITDGIVAGFKTAGPSSLRLTLGGQVVLTESGRA